MKKVLFVSLTLLLAGFSLQAQLPRYYDFLHLYQDAEELFEKEKYGAAQKKIEAFLIFEDDLRADEANDLHANARYIQAVSAYFLEREDAEALLESFLREFPENTKAALANYALGKHYFDKRKYSKAIKPFVLALQSTSLSQERFDEVVFKLGYSYYQDKNPRQAIQYFDMSGNKRNVYQEDARYYKAIILYEEENYVEAHQALLDLKQSPKYAQETRVYLANTLFKLRKMDELFVLADDLVRGPKVKKNEAQIYYIVANASFEKEDYPKTTEYFDEYKKNRGKLNRTDYFRFGYAYYQQQNHEEAIPLFQRVIKQDATDSLSQVASYYLGFSLLEEGNEDAAKLAFYKAAQGGLQNVPTITQDALYQYAKVAFATESYGDALQALNQIIKDYPRASYIEEVKTMIGEVYLYQRNYPEAVKYFERSPRTTRRAKLAYQTVCYFYGLELFEQPAYNQALQWFQKTIDNTVDNELTLNAKYWKGETNFRKGEFSRAENAFQDFINSRGASSSNFYAKGLYGLGWSHFKQKEYTNALSKFQQFVDKADKDESKKIVVDAFTRIGDCYFLKKDYGNAIKTYERVMRFKYIYRDYAGYQIAEAYYRQNNYSQSVSTFDKLITSFRKSSFRDDALDRISEIYATWIKDYRKALNYAKTLVQDYPKSPLAATAYNRMALASYNLGDQSSAIQYYKKILTDYGNDRNNAQAALDNLAGLVSEREFDRILRDYRNSNPQMDEGLAELVFTTGKDRFFAGNYNSAIDQFTTYIKDYKNGPNYFEALLLRARAYKETGKFPNALKDYKVIYEATMANSYTYVALLEAAEILFEQRNYTESLSLYQQLADNAGQVQNQVQGLLGIAKNQKALGVYSAAESALQEIIDNIEVTVYSRTEAMVEKGNVQYLSGNLEAALQTYQGVEADFKNAFGAESQYMIAKIYFDQGKTLKDQGQDEAADEKFIQVIDATKYMANNYPTHNYLKAKTFLVAAEAYYERGKVFQAKGTLGSLIQEDRFPDIQEQAKDRLEEIEAEEEANENN